MTWVEYIVLTLGVLFAFATIAFVAGAAAVMWDLYKYWSTRRKYEDTHAIHPKFRDYDGGE